MIYAIIQVVAIFFIPLLIIKYHHKPLTKLIGTIGMAYLLGILVSLLIFGLRKIGFNFTINQDIGQIGSHLAISIAIPLLLFSANLRETKKLSKTVLLSFGSVIVSVIIVSSIAFYLYGKTIENGAYLSGMAVGLYTGGTPNLNAIASIFSLDTVEIGIANLSDMIIGAVFYVFLLLLCKPLLQKLLPFQRQAYLRQSSSITNTEELNLKEFKHSKKLVQLFLLAFLMAVIGALIGLVIWMILGSPQGRMTDILVPAMMVSVTVFGIMASFNKKIREVKGSNVMGQYLILVFSFALASSLDLTQLSIGFTGIFLLYLIITIGTFVLHVFISYLLKIDAECTMVTLTAGVYGPAFVPAITKQIKNDELTVPGLICGSLGYAIGTFLGMLLALLFLL